MYTCCLCTVGQVVRTLPEGGQVLGVTSLGDEIYVLRGKEVEVYDVITYLLQRCLTVPDSCELVDLTSCEHHRCVYIADGPIQRVHRLDVQGDTKQWPVDDEPQSLSVNAAHNVLLTCTEACKIKEFSSHGNLLGEVTLCDDVVNPWHTMELITGQFIVCHSNFCADVDRVCKISADGCYVIHSHGGKPGSDADQYNQPFHLAVDNNGFVLVAEFGNRRVKLLSPTLNYVREVVSPKTLKWGPDKLCFDATRRRLYVADNEWRHDYALRAGRVVVFRV